MQVFISSETYQVRCLLFIVGAEPQRADQHRGLLLHLRPRARAAARHPRRGPARAQARQHSVILSQVDWKIPNWIKGEFGLLPGKGWAWERGGGARRAHPDLPAGAGPRVRAVRLQDGPRRGELESIVCYPGTKRLINLTYGIKQMIALEVGANLQTCLNFFSYLIVLLPEFSSSQDTVCTMWRKKNLRFLETNWRPNMHTSIFYMIVFKILE